MKINYPLRIIFIYAIFISCEPDTTPDESEEIPTIEIIEISDPNFKYALLNTNCVDINNDNIGDQDIDSNNDGIIQRSEAQFPEGLILKFNEEEIQRYVDLKGIENFINLKHLEIIAGESGYVENEKTEHISYDFTALRKLEFIQINYFHTDFIQKIDLSGLDNLIEANLSDNRPSNFTLEYNVATIFTDLNLEGCSSLKKLMLRNSFSKINFCHAPNLEIIDMSYLEGGEPTIFDFHCLSNLKRLDISENFIDTLILKNSSLLETLIANNIGSEDPYFNYPFLKSVCIDDIPEELLQISKLIDENTVVNTDCTF